MKYLITLIILAIILTLGMGESPPRYFNSLEELEGWLSEQNTDYPDIYCKGSNCLNNALALQDLALKDGYYMNLEISDTFFYHRQFYPSDNSLYYCYSYTEHAYNSTIAGGYVYWIEPKSLIVSRPDVRIY